MQRFFCSILLILGFSTMCVAQDQRLYVSADNRAPADFFSDLSLQTGINIIYSEQVIQKLPRVTLVLKGATVDEVMTRMLQGTGISYTYAQDQIVLFQSVNYTNRFTISGVVTDSLSGEPLISAYIYDGISGKTTTTNNYGYYSLTVPQSRIELLAGYLNYNPKIVQLTITQNEIIPLRLHPNGLLPEIIINAERTTDRARAIVPPAVRLSFNELQSTMHLGGTSDLYRAAEFIPGFHTGTDGVGGIHVRGGANDQNLILMDGVPVYHPNHLFGIVSVFNYQVLQQASVYKANFPSRFSGRLSSIMDVRTREGNLNEWAFSGNVSLSEIGALAEGPLVKDKVSVLFSSRFFLPGLVMPDLTRKYKERNGIEGSADLDYFDFNGKINWKINDKDRLYLSMYYGADKFADQSRSVRDEIDREENLRILTDEQYDKSFRWQNLTAVLRWNHIVSDKIFANIILSTSEFELQSVDSNDITLQFPDDDFAPINLFAIKEFKSGISDITAKVELDIRPAQDHSLAAGIYGIKYRFSPKSVTINEQSKVGDFYLDEGLLDDQYFDALKVSAVEAGVYFEDRWEIKDKLILSNGLHISGFFVDGIYYLDPQLRMSLDYLPSPQFAFNIGYSRMAQYLHNLTSSSIGLPTDLWVPTTDSVKPALSDQYALAGLWRLNDHFSMDVAGYIKDMRSLISYQEGASFLVRGDILPSSIVDAAEWESKVTEGVGDAAGLELQLQYNRDRFQVRANSTWSRSYRTFEEINEGESFPDRYDRKWSSSVSTQFKLGTKWLFGMSWVYGTGIAITLAESTFFNPGTFFPETGVIYTKRNALRLPPYHRLDMNITYEMAKRNDFQHSITVNLYNMYNRTNPFYITLVEDPINGDFEFRQFSLFKFFPSVSYRFAFK
jgi:outer membrane receptor for ferrienterochelin and colicin